MSREPSSGATVKLKSGDRPQPNDTTPGIKGWLKRRDWGRIVAGVWILAAASATGLNIGLVQVLERQVQTVFFELRGPVTPPKDIVILAIDESSLSQKDLFQLDPQRYSSLAPIQSWPWQRQAYAIAIDRLMGAGAKAVGVDVIFSNPSTHGDADDQQLAQVLQRYDGRVVLAAQYAEADTPQGPTAQLTSPLLEFCAVPACSGFINYPLEPDGRIHRFGERFLSQFLENSPPLQAAVLEKLPSFASATLRAAQMPYPSPYGDSIFFYGPAQSFEHIPFWYVLDPTAWDTYLQSGYFKNKIVLIGSTAAVQQDFHAAPFSQSVLYPNAMAGVEIHANAIASLLEGRSIAEAVPQLQLRGILVLVGLLLVAWLFTRPQLPLRRLAWAVLLAVIWLGCSFGLFVQARLMVPTALPVGAILFSGFSQLVVGAIRDQLRKQHLRATLKQYMTSPIVQEIISQQEDFQDLLRDRELILSGKVLGNRYQIAKVLGSGGFSETYIAKDLQRPGNPLCVVKQLRVISDDPKTLKLARRLFATEAETLERLGQHDQIPQLLASFEENYEFYLIQEFIQGNPLSKEVGPRRSLSEMQVLQVLSDLLEVLDFVHSQGVIHRDLKPSNIIRRQSDGKLVLIDFGVAKKITTQLAGTSEAYTQFTISVGTPGYMPGEQSAGYPQFNSDIYALGMICIESLTGRPPHTLNHDARTGAITWMAPDLFISPDLEVVLNRMVHHDFMQRYRSVQDVRAALAPLFHAFNPPRRGVDLDDEFSTDLSQDTAIANMPEGLSSYEDTAIADMREGRSHYEDTAIADVTEEQSHYEDTAIANMPEDLAHSEDTAIADTTDIIPPDATSALPDDWADQTQHFE